MEAPLKRLERKLHVPVYFFIMPLFAFVNAGIELRAEILENTFTSALTWGIILGLSIGKLTGILLATWLLLKFVFKNMPHNRETWNVLVGVALLCGIGFTMSLFITNLSYTDAQARDYAKMGVLAASMLCGVAGYLILYRGTVKPKKILEDDFSNI